MSEASKEKLSFKTLDEAFCDLSVMLHTFPKNPSFGVDFLVSEKLDYSLASLEHIDDYLEKIRKDPDVEEEWNTTVLRTGAYIGEVIRRSDKQERWHWVDHETAFKLDPGGWKDVEKSIFTCAVLYKGGKTFCFPLGQVFKFMDNGKQDSVQSFAKVIIARWSAEKA